MDLSLLFSSGTQLSLIVLSLWSSPVPIHRAVVSSWNYGSPDLVNLTAKTLLLTFTLIHSILHKRYRILSHYLGTNEVLTTSQVLQTTAQLMRGVFSLLYLLTLLLFLQTNHPLMSNLPGISLLLVSSTFLLLHWLPAGC